MATGCAFFFTRRRFCPASSPGALIAFLARKLLRVRRGMSREALLRVRRGMSREAGTRTGTSSRDIPRRTRNSASRDIPRRTRNSFRARKAIRAPGDEAGFCRPCAGHLLAFWGLQCVLIRASGSSGTASACCDTCNYVIYLILCVY